MNEVVRDDQLFFHVKDTIRTGSLETEKWEAWYVSMSSSFSFVMKEECPSPWNHWLNMISVYMMRSILLKYQPNNPCT